MQDYTTRLLVQIQYVKSWQVITPALTTTVTKNERKTLKTNTFSYTHQRHEVARQTAVVKFVGKGEYRNSQLSSPYLGSNWQDHSDGNFNKLLGAECGLA